MTTSWPTNATADQVAEALQSVIKGKNILVTGTSPKSLGAECVRVLAKYAHLVILAGRNKEKLERSIAAVKEETPNANLRMLMLDLSSFASVRRAAAELNSLGEPLHVLINNAALTPAGLTVVDGIEAQFYGDHLCHFLFTNLLLPRLLAARSVDFSPRIVNISSSAHAWSGIRFDDYNFTDGSYGLFIAYGQSKTANILFTLELQKRWGKEGILSYAVHPGGVDTNLADSTKDELIAQGIMNADGTFASGASMKTLAQGTATHIVAAFDPSIEDQSGSYLADCQVHNEKRAAHATDPESAAKLWALSEQLVGQVFS